MAENLVNCTQYQTNKQTKPHGWTVEEFSHGVIQEEIACQIERITTGHDITKCLGVIKLPNSLHARISCTDQP